VKVLLTLETSSAWISALVLLRLTGSKLKLSN
jgi:hypothetical protein